MAISDLLPRDLPRVKKGPTCETCALLGSLPDDEAAALRRLLANPSVRYKWLAQKLKDDEGHVVPHTSLGRHARGDCDAHERLRGER